MKGDKFREMAARCGDLPDSVMTVPGLEYVGAKSAGWEALCVKAAGWADVDPGVIYSDPADQCAWEPGCYAWELEHDEFAFGLRYLALFARLMAIVTREG